MIRQCQTSWRILEIRSTIRLHQSDQDNLICSSEYVLTDAEVRKHSRWAYIVQGRLTHHQAHFLPAVSHQLYHMITRRSEIIFMQIFSFQIFFLYRATSSPLIESIWSPGISLSTLGPPPVTNLKQTNLSIIQDKSWINLISILSSIFRTAGNCWGDFQRTSVTEIVSKTLKTEV